MRTLVVLLVAITSMVVATARTVEALAGPIKLVPVLSGLVLPVFATHAGDGSQRLFVVEQGGIVKVVAPGGVDPTVFLDISFKVLQEGERGLLGLAFHPGFATNRRFFVHYTRQPDGATVIAEYRASADAPDLADPLSEIVLLVLPQPSTKHKGGMVAFGPDGFLYLAIGDGGPNYDPNNRAQDIDQLLGKILRIDVNTRNGSVPYSSPPGNPFVGLAGADEIFATGFRNPWRFSFDRQTGDLYVGDVGQDAVEEIDIVTVGGNYGWRIWEGTPCSGLDPGLCDPKGFVFPIAQYVHAAGRCAVMGGYVYRGAQASLPLGSYVFGDLCTGEIFVFDNGTVTVALGTGLPISSFGEDESGELYVVHHSGIIDRIVPVVRVTPGAHDFGNVVVGGGGQAVFSITNMGESVLAGSASTAPPFSVVAGGSYSLPPGASQQVTVRFQPTAAGLSTGTVTFTHDGGPLSRGLTGTGANPAPVIAGLSPSHTEAGGPGFRLVVTGTNFVTGSVVRWNGASRPTTFVDSAELWADIPAGDVQFSGPALVTVVTPSPGGGTSNALTFAVGFVDVPQSHPFATWIAALVQAGITTGCASTPPMFCPDQAVTRAEMAVFLLRGMHGAAGFTPPPPSGLFADVPTTGVLAPWVEQLFTEGVTSGCGGNPLAFCPQRSVTRGEAAVFLLRAKHGAGHQPSAAAGIFADVAPDHPLGPWIEQLFNEGITGGCGTGPLRYCPDAPITRGQMAVFLARALGLPL